MENNIQDSTEVREPEDAIAIAKYSLELIQQDLNMGRRETIAPRLTKAVDTLVNLQNIFPAIPAPKVIISDDVAKEYYLTGGYTMNLPKSIGLYRVATKNNGWFLNYVAVTMNDYREFCAHDESGISNVGNYAERNGGSACYWIKVG